MARTLKPPLTPQSPGEVLKAHVFNEKGLSQEMLANALGVSRLSINQLINGKRSVTVDMALRLARVLSTTPEFWLDIQRQYDLFEARRKLNKELSDLPVLRKGAVAK